MNDSFVFKRFPLISVGAVFLALWAFHLYSAGGTLVPYRDAGEMVVNARTLGVAHPPGYPLYVLLGKMADLLPLGNPAYRLNLLSALGAAACGTALFLLLGGARSFLIALGGAALWASTPLFRELGAVSEMYAPAMFVAVALLGLARRERAPWPLIYFLLGLGLGLRTDLVLLLPALLTLHWTRDRGRGGWLGAAAFLAGLSIFLYLPLRSAQEPWLDWNNPETFSNLMGTLLRRTHGGTLDLLSKSYSTGENFWPVLRLFSVGAAFALAGVGLPLALGGAKRLRREEPRYLAFLLIIFVLFGPVFFFMANMPPNPHAMAIVEAHFLAPLLVLVVLAALGAQELRGFLAGTRFRAWAAAIPAAILLGAAAWNVGANQARAHKRWNFYARDFVTNALRTSAPGSVAVLKKDVQLFSFWAEDATTRARPDVGVVAQGLAASPWYHEMMRRRFPSLVLGPLASREDWGRFASRNVRPLWLGEDTGQSGEGLSIAPWGLSIYFSSPPAAASRVDPFGELYVFRGPRRAPAAPDFFASNLLTDYGGAAMRRASFALKAGDLPGAERRLRFARVFDPESPTAPFHLGYAAFQAGRLDEAERYYRRASVLYEETFRRAARYKALPHVVDGLRREAGEAWIHRGVLSEKQGSIESAREAYARALALNPRAAQAHYNWAVTYWNRDWNQVVGHLSAAAALEPGNAAYASYLDRARRLARGEAP